MISDFTYGTTVVFTGTVSVDGTATELGGDDTITLILKNEYEDDDADGVLTSTAAKTAPTGGIQFSLSPSDTAIDPHQLDHST